MLDRLLEYHETPPPDDFVAEVMRGVRRQQRARKLILSFTGSIGAAFGAAGLFMLAEPVNRILGETDVTTISMGIIVAACLVTWLFYDDAGLTS